MPDKTPLSFSFNLPFDEAIAAARARGVVLPEAFYALPAEKRQHAQTISGIIQLDQIKSVQDKLAAYLQGGKNFSDFQREVGAMDFGLSPGKIDLVFRNGVQNAYNAGHWRHFEQHKDSRPYLMYDAVNDSRTRPAHRAMDGLIMPVDDPRWVGRTPSCGHRCRCKLISLSEAQMSRRGGVTGDIPAGAVADEGWGYKPEQQGEALKRIEADKVAKANPVFQEAYQHKKSKSIFEEQKTAKAAAEWAVKNNLADFADYSGIKPEVANAWNKSMFDHLQEFPELRKDQKFIGTCQAQFARWREIQIQRSIADMRIHNPTLPDDFDFRPHAEKFVKAMKVDGDAWAHAWSQVDVSGVAINKKWAVDVAAFENSIKKAGSTGWHPVGCDTIKSVVDHEIGHMLDHHLDLRIDNDIKKAYQEAIAKGIKQEVSGYAEKNIAEFIAECWAESCNNPAPREFAQKIATIVRDRYRAKYP